MDADQNIAFTRHDIKKIRKHEKKTQQGFADLMGVSREMVNKLETGKLKISSNVTLWLMNRYGSRLDTILSKKSHLSEKENSYKSGIPVFETYLSASFVKALKEEEAPEPAFYMKGNQFADCTFGALAKGDYAMNLLSNGDFLLCREVEDHQFIDHSCMYFIIGKTGLEICRYIHPHPTDTRLLLLKSDQETVPPTPMPKQYIRHLFKIRGVIRSF